MPQVSWNLRLTVNQGQLSDLRQLMSEMIAATRDETGCLTYQWYLSSDETELDLVEAYADSDAAMKHLAGFGQHWAERFLACLTPVSFRVYGDPSAEVREALAGFGAVHLAHAGGFQR